MCQLLESIRFENGQWHNLHLHEARMMRARKKHFGITTPVRLSELISIPTGLTNERYKCRILYGLEILEIRFELYQRGIINNIQLVTDNNISYSYKYADRRCITRHTKNLPPQYEIIIVKNGFLRDASYSNVALFNGHEWHTPAHPLLKGTKREALLENGEIKAKMIKANHLGRYKKVSFINALNDLGELCCELAP